MAKNVVDVIEDDDYSFEYELIKPRMFIKDCPNCGLVATYTNTCGYCGENCND